MDLKPLLLAGGYSSRMGTRKESLLLPNGRPVYEHLLSILHHACPEAEAVFLSQRDSTATKELLSNSRIIRESDNEVLLDADGSSMTVRIIHDEDNLDIGPAAGLLAAYHQHPTTTWLVAACDYPFLSSSALLQLREEQAGSVTCFSNDEGFCEPLLGIWSPDALQMLEEHVRNGILGPSSVVRRLQGKTIRPRERRWLFNTNTPAEWKRAMELLENNTWN